MARDPSWAAERLRDYLKLLVEYDALPAGDYGARLGSNADRLYGLMLASEETLDKAEEALGLTSSQ